MLYLNRVKKVFFVIFFVFFSTKSFAGLWDYTFHIEKQTTDYNTARETAIKEHRKIALENVISKIVSVSEFKVISKLLDEDTAYFFEDKLKLSHENVTNDFYSVYITYYFDKNKILSFLSKSGIAYVLNLNNKILVIPVVDNKINVTIDWYKAWEGIKSTDYLTKIFLLKDITTIDEAKILEKNKEYLEQLKSEYNVDNVIIANLEYNSQTPCSFNNDINKECFTLNVINFVQNTFQSFECLNIYEALKYTIGLAELTVKCKSIDLLEQKNTMVFKVTYNSFIDWVAIYNYLKQTPQIEAVILSEIGSNYCFIKIKYHGILDEIIKNAATHNIIVDPAELSIGCKGFCF